ncbi:MAG: hypothetical protein SFY92_06160, partial [Verrucomicrobiae bacterium]|nr:hypothetical protein [Verrucomicrobiae bacterium]
RCCHHQMMEKVNTDNSVAPHAENTFPKARKSHCAGQSFDAEMKRLRAMTIEQRVLEALGMNERFAWITPVSKD